MLQQQKKNEITKNTVQIADVISISLINNDVVAYIPSASKKVTIFIDTANRLRE